MIIADKSASGFKENNGALKSLNILLAEDCENNVLLVQLYLKKLPYTIDVAENGEIAVEKFMQNDYDIVLMDIEMPCTDGYEATGRIRSYEKSRSMSKTPIIAVTAHALPENEDRAYAAGCDYFLTKPVKKNDLIEVVQRFTA